MSEKKITIRLETKDDYRNVENLTREAFWNVYRPGCMEYYVLHCYRDDPAFVPELDFVMELDGELIGQVIYVWSEIDCDDGRKVPIMTFGPIGIAPAYKRQGYGKKLLDYSMEKAKEMGAGALAITGNIDFYGKSGFVPAKIKGTRNLYRMGMAAFGGIAPTYHIELLEKPTIYWDFHSLLLGIQMMFSFLLVDGEKPLRLCKHCQKVFLSSRSNSAFCSPRCKNQYNVYKSRGKKTSEED